MAGSATVWLEASGTIANHTTPSPSRSATTAHLATSSRAGQLISPARARNDLHRPLLIEDEIDRPGRESVVADREVLGRGREHEGDEIDPADHRLTLDELGHRVVTPEQRREQHEEAQQRPDGGEETHREDLPHVARNATATSPHRSVCFRWRRRCVSRRRDVVSRREVRRRRGGRRRRSASMTSSVWATPTKIASYAPGAIATPLRSMAWKNRP